jgi:hypothetical protein
MDKLAKGRLDILIWIKGPLIRGMLVQGAELVPATRRGESVCSFKDLLTYR